MTVQATAALPLQGMGILVTRPVQQADRLCRLIEAQGGTTIRFPTLEILAPQDLTPALAIIDRLDDYALAIFISANAVSHGLALIRERRVLPPQLRRIAIGQGTARELERWGAPAHRLPGHTFNSEALLALPEMQAVAGQRIVIFRGQGGRELLGDTLRERGARVAYAEVYRRAKPIAPANKLLECWACKKIHVVIVTSPDSLRNLFDIVGEGGQQWLCHTPLIVVSARTRQLAQQLGFSHSPLLAREASDEAIVETLIEMAPSPIRVTSGDP